MYPEALTHLRCPDCLDIPLILAAGARLARNGEITHGELHCERCPASYSIDRGIADLLGSRARPDSPAQVTNYLPITAWGYERLWRWYALTLLSGEAFAYDRELALVTALMAPERGGLYVDLGCSNGLYARALTRKLPPDRSHVIGIDHSLPMLCQARTFAQHTRQRISFVRAKAQALPFADGTVAGVPIGGSLNEIGDVTGCLHEVRRVLAPTGRCVLMSLAQARSHAGRALQTFLGLGGLMFWTDNDLNDLLQSHGLRLAAQWRYSIVVFRLLLKDNENAIPVYQ